MLPNEQRGFSAPADWLKEMNLERKNYERLLRRHGANQGIEVS
jgi:hypothetical protein